MTPKDIHVLGLVSVSLYGIGNYAAVIQDFEMEKLSWFIRRQRGRFDYKREGDMMTEVEIRVMHLQEGRRGHKSRNTGCHLELKKVRK